MTDPGDMQRLREALDRAIPLKVVVWNGNRLHGEMDKQDRTDIVDACLRVLAEGWVAPQSPDGASRFAADRSVPTEEPLATPQAEVEALRSCAWRLDNGWRSWSEGGSGERRCLRPGNIPMVEPMTALEQEVMGRG